MVAWTKSPEWFSTVRCPKLGPENSYRSGLCLILSVLIRTVTNFWSNPSLWSMFQLGNETKGPLSWKKTVFEIMNDSSLANWRLQSVTKCMQLDFNHHFLRWYIFLFGKKFWTNRYVKLGTLYTTSDFISEKILYNTY